MIVTPSRERLYVSLGHSFWDIFMWRLNTVGRCVASGYNNTKDEENDFSIHEIPFYGHSRPKAIKRRRKWISFVNSTRKNLSVSTEKKKHSTICSVHFAPDDFTCKFSFKDQSLPKAVKTWWHRSCSCAEISQCKIFDRSVRSDRNVPFHLQKFSFPVAFHCDVTEISVET